MADEKRKKWQCRDCGTDHFCAGDIPIHKCESCGSAKMKRVDAEPGDPDPSDLGDMADRLLELLTSSPEVVEKLPEGLRIELCAKKVAVSLADTAKGLKLTPAHAVQIAARVVSLCDEGMQHVFGEILKTEGVDRVARELIESLDKNKDKDD